MTVFVDDFGVLRIIYPRDYDVGLSPCYMRDGQYVMSEDRSCSSSYLLYIKSTKMKFLIPCNMNFI